MKQYDPLLVGRQFADDGWRKATFSADDNAQGCVEVNFADNGDVGVRDSKQPDRGTFVFSPHEWACFVKGANAGEFNHPQNA